MKYDMRSNFTSSDEEVPTNTNNAQMKSPLPIGEVYEADGFSLALTDVRVGRVKYDDKFDSKPDVLQTDDEFLLCMLTLTAGERKVVHYDADFSSTAEGSFVLDDDVNNAIRGIRNASGREIVGALADGTDIPPGEQRTHLRVFAVPPKNTKHLILTVNLAVFGSSGEVKYIVPVEKITGFPGR